MNTEAERAAPTSSRDGLSISRQEQAACTCGSSLHRATCPAFQRFESVPRDFVSIAFASLVFVGVADRAKFDSLALECTDHGADEKGHVLTKAARAGPVTVVFQHWIKQLTVDAMIADRDAQRAAKESAS